ncbi:PilW family protein [Ideonella sp.]|jgi:type IV pilus assembly protein PilW|uniref:PilW family protein n=1 Tax=Ideonella sp. TaxID=1929293 RepID=UPI0037C1A186
MTKLATSRGMTLVELMVAMLLGLLLAGAALSTFLASSQLARSMRGAATVSDGGQSFTSYIAQQIRAAGHVDLMERDGQWSVLTSADGQVGAPNSGDGSLLALDSAGNFPGLYSIKGCSGAFKTPTTLLDFACAPDVNSTVSSLTVAYQVLSTPEGWVAPSLAETFNANRGFQTDCGGRGTRTGQSATANPAGDLVINRYYLDTAERRLMCIGNGDPSRAVQVAADIEQFQVLYATSQASSTSASAISRFVLASEVNSMVNGWASVVAVQVCVLAVGEPGSSAAGSAGTNVFNVDCSGNAANANDGRIRRAHRTTINLRSGSRSATVMP